MMKVPGGTEGRGAGEWWTGIADWRELEKIKTEDEGVLERLAGDGNKFGMSSTMAERGIMLISRLCGCCFGSVFRWNCGWFGSSSELRGLSYPESESEGSEMERSTCEKEGRIW